MLVPAINVLKPRRRPSADLNNSVTRVYKINTYLYVALVSVRNYQVTEALFIA